MILVFDCHCTSSLEQIRKHYISLFAKVDILREPAWRRGVSPAHLETHTRSQTPRFLSYPMDMTWILQHQVYFLAKCHIHVISMAYLIFKKDIFGYTWYPKLKKLHLVYTSYISFHVICHAYPCPIHVISLSGCPAPASK